MCQSQIEAAYIHVCQFMCVNVSVHVCGCVYLYVCALMCLHACARLRMPPNQQARRAVA